MLFGPSAPRVKGGIDLAGDDYDADSQSATYQPVPHPDPNPLDCNGHGSHVAGITSANGMFGGKMTGAAPGAKIKSVRVCLFVEGCTNHAMVEGMTWLAKTAKVDVINMSIGGLPALNDGNNTRAVLYDRLIDEYGVQIFISAGNSGKVAERASGPAVDDGLLLAAAPHAASPAASTAEPTRADRSLMPERSNNIPPVEVKHRGKNR